MNVLRTPFCFVCSCVFWAYTWAWAYSWDGRFFGLKVLTCRTWAYIRAWALFRYGRYYGRIRYSHVSMINPLLHCAASVDSQCLLISIAMSVIPYHCCYNGTECKPRLYISIVLITIAKRRLPIPGLYT